MCNDEIICAPPPADPDIPFRPFDPVRSGLPRAVRRAELQFGPPHHILARRSPLTDGALLVADVAYRYARQAFGAHTGRGGCPPKPLCPASGNWPVPTICTHGSLWQPRKETILTIRIFGAAIPPGKIRGVLPTAVQRKRMMVARAKLSAKKLKALEALLIQPRVAEAAAAAGIAPHVLQRWISTDREFGAAWRAATGATHRQCRRRLGQGYIQAVQSTIQLMYSAPKASTRLKAARDVIALAREANEFAELVAAVADAERLVAAAQAGSLADGKRGKPGIRAHGAKFPRCQEKAVTALLTERSIAGAARAAGISTPTLYRWLKVPAFLARYAAAAEQVFGEGMRWAQMKEGDAVTIIRNCRVIGRYRRRRACRRTVTSQATPGRRRSEIWTGALRRRKPLPEMPGAWNPEKNGKPWEGISIRD